MQNQLCQDDAIVTRSQIQGVLGTAVHNRSAHAKILRRLTQSTQDDLILASHWNRYFERGLRVDLQDSFRQRLSDVFLEELLVDLLAST